MSFNRIAWLKTCMAAIPVQGTWPLRVHAGRAFADHFPASSNGRGVCDSQKPESHPVFLGFRPVYPCNAGQQTI